MLGGLAGAVETALRTQQVEGQLCDRSVTFDQAFLAQRMVYVFGRLTSGYWALHRAVHSVCSDLGLAVEARWGPHLTLTRFASTAGSKQVELMLEALRGWSPITAAPTAVIVGYYTVAPGAFRVDHYATFDLKAE
jgi:hypothetical protein